MLRLYPSLIGLGILCSFPLSGCGPKATSIKGVAPEATPDATVKTLSHASMAQKVTLQGEMTEKCPVAGCWFMLRDKTGIVRVDTKASGFVVSDVPLHTLMTVTGTVVPGAQPGLAASGIRY